MSNYPQLADQASVKSAGSYGMDKEQALLKEVRENIQRSYEAERDNRREMALDLSFASGDQWPETVRADRERTGRPMITVNRLPQFINQVVNDIRQAEFAMKPTPVDDQSDPNIAKVYQGIIRQIEYQSSMKSVVANWSKDQVTCGAGWVRVVTDYVDDQTFDQEIKIKHIPNPLSVYCDPAATEPDRSDGEWMMVVEDIPRQTFKQRWPKASDQEVSTPVDYFTSQLYWFTDDVVKIAEYWKKEEYERTIAQAPTGEVVDVSKINRKNRRMFGMQDWPQRKVKSHKIKMWLVSGGDILEGPFEWSGKYIPLVPAFGTEVPLEHQRYRYGLVRFARDAQQLYNYYRTSAAEWIALSPRAPWVVTNKQIRKYKGEWDNAHLNPRPYLPYEPDPEAPGAPQREMPWGS